MSNCCDLIVARIYLDRFGGLFFATASKKLSKQAKRGRENATRTHSEARMRGVFSIPCGRRSSLDLYYGYIPTKYILGTVFAYIAPAIFKKQKK